MTGAEIPTWALFFIAVVMGVTAIFLEKIAERLWSLYQIKRLKYLVWGIVGLVFVLWLGWPWPRPQNLFAEISPKQQVISEIWMSEQDAELFIIKKLQDDSDRVVFERRVRYLLRLQIRSYVIGRFLCESDSTWRPLNKGALATVTSLDLFDGTKRLSEFIGCKVQYSTEYIHRRDWVKVDKEAYVIPPNPESPDSR